MKTVTKARERPLRLPRIGLLAVLAVAAAALLPATASASTVAECQAKIQTLKADTATVQISGQNADKDRAALIGKLDEASMKLDQGKFADAVQKLDDFKFKVGQLAEAGKVSSEDAQRLTAEADDAIACINSVSSG